FTVTANLDTAAAVHAKRSVTVHLSTIVDVCNFDIVVGGRDLAGRTSEFVGQLALDQSLVANGVPIQSGDRVDPHTAFQFQYTVCSPLGQDLPLGVVLDGAPISDVTIRHDPAQVNWTADFTLGLTAGAHHLRFTLAGQQLADYDVTVGGFGMSDLLAFPNPMRKSNEAVRAYFPPRQPHA